MTDIQRRAIAAGFLHALQASPDVYKEWSAIDKADYAAIGALIQKTMSLSQAPSKDDLNAMAAYVDAHLQQHVSAIKAEHDDVPHHVGILVAMQQS